MSAEAKVGLLVIVVALLAVGTAIFLSGVLRDIGAYRITVMFENVYGLDRGASVRLRGVTVGQVREVTLEGHPEFPDKQVAVLCTIRPETVIYKEDTFMVVQGALVGDKYLSITQLPEQKGRHRLEDGAVVGGSGASGAEIVMDEAQRLLTTARTAVQSVDAMLGDEAVQENVKATVANLRAASESVVAIADATTRVVQGVARAESVNEARLSEMMQNLVAASEDIAVTTQRVQDMVALTPVPAQIAAAGENIVEASESVAAMAEETRARVADLSVDADLEATMASLREASESLREMSANAAEITGDEQMREDLRTTAENVREATESLRSAAQRVDELVGDEQINEDVRATISTVRETAESGREAIGRADRIMTDIEGTLETVRRTQELVTDIQARPYVQLIQAREGGFRADAAFDVRGNPEATAFWRVGLRDVGSSDSLDLQFAQQRGRDVFRAGLIGGSLGVAYDWREGDRLGVQAEAYDPNDLRLDLRLRMSVRRDYDLLLGLDRAFDRNDPTIGVGYWTDF